jgi:hypothetical protein
MKTLLCKGGLQKMSGVKTVSHLFLWMGGSRHFIPGPGSHFWGAEAPPKTEPRGISSLFPKIPRVSAWSGRIPAANRAHGKNATQVFTA